MRLPSGTPGFDALLDGGFVPGSTLVLHGAPGRVRNAFLIQFIGEALREGAPAFVVLSTDSATAYREALRAAGFDSERAAAENRLRLIEWRPTRVPPDDRAGPEKPGSPPAKELANLGAEISRAVQGLPTGGTKRAVLEILSPALVLGDLLRVYALAQSMRTKLERSGFTSLFVLDAKKGDEETVSTLREAFGGVLDLTVHREGNATVTRIAVQPLREPSPQTEGVALEFGPDHRLRVRPSELSRRALTQEEEPRKASPGVPAPAPEPKEQPTSVARGSGPTAPDTRRLSPLKPRSTPDARGFTNGVQAGAVRGVGPARGLVNGTPGPGPGRVNGLTRNRQGRTNGVSQAFSSLRSGLTNGLTTSAGFTNGLGSPRLRREVGTLRQRLLLIPLLVAALLLLPLFTSPGPIDPIAIDGASSDWAGVNVATFSRTPGLDPSVEIVRFGTTDNGNSLAFLVEVDGFALRGGDAPPTVDRFDVFVDTDRNASTGYRVEGLGADRLIELTGWQGAVNTTALFEWDPGQDPYDWRGWFRTRAVRAAVAGRALEAQVDWLALGVSKGPVFAIVQARGFDGSTDVGDYALNPFGGALVVVQEPIPAPTLTGPNVPLLRLDITAYGTEAELEGLTLALTGSAPSTAVGSLRILDGNGSVVDQRVPLNGRATFQFAERRYPTGVSERLVVVADSLSATGETLGAILENSSAVFAPDAVVTVQRVPSVRDVGYIGSEVSFPRIDRGFAEWTSAVSDPAGDVQGGRDDDVDLGAFAAESSGSGTFFFAHVEGRLMAGTWVPERNFLATRLSSPADRDRDGVPDVADPLPDDFDNDGTPDAQAAGDADGDGALDYGNGGPDLWLNTTIPTSFPSPYAGQDVRVYVGPVERPFRARDDILRVFVDIDNSSTSGYQVGGLGADRLLEVAGNSGNVRSSGLFNFSGASPGQWSWAWLSDVPSALAFDYLEFSANEILLNDSRVYVEIGEALGAVDTLGGISAASLVGSQPTTPVSSRSASSFEVAPSPFSAPAEGSPLPPRVLDIPGNQVFYLRQLDHAEDDPACTTDKVADAGPNVAPVNTISLNTGQVACWYLDATTGTTIPAGSWESLLDVATSGGGVIGFDVAGTGTGSGTTIDIAGPSVSSGPDRLLLVGVGQGNTAAPLTSVTWDQGGTNQSMTLITGVSRGTNTRVELWKLLAPTSGARTLRIVSPSSIGVAVGIVAYYGVDQTTPNDAPATANGGPGSSPSVTISSSSGDLVVDAVSSKEDLSNKNPGPGQTERYEVSGGDEIAFGSEEAGAASVTMSWTGTFEEWVQIGLSLNPSSWSVEYDVVFDVWDKPTNTVKTTIGSCLDVVATGDDVQCLISPSEQVLDSNDVVRIRVAHSSPAGSVVIEYDDADSTGDSRVTVPIPEFDAVALPFLSLVLVSAFVVRKRRSVRRRGRASPESRRGATPSQEMRASRD